MTCSILLLHYFVLSSCLICLCVILAFLVYYARLMWLWYIGIWLDCSACHSIISGNAMHCSANALLSCSMLCLALCRWSVPRRTTETESTCWPLFIWLSLLFLIFVPNVWSVRHFNLHNALCHYSHSYYRTTRPQYCLPFIHGMTLTLIVMRVWETIENIS